MNQLNREKNATPVISPKDLEALVKDLEEVHPWRGLVKSSLGFLLFIGLAISAVLVQSAPISIGLAIIAGLVVTTLMVMTHDAIHHTLTGWAWYDELYPLAVSYPLLWPHRTYREIHKIHHKMNGSDPNDPERVQWTVEEYDKANSFMKFYVRHQWPIDIFILGGIGYIGVTLSKALPFARHIKSVRRALIFDAIGILAVNGLIYGVCIANGLGWKYLFLYFLVERLVGALQQLRAHTEHYGRFGKAGHYFETQIFNCRNIRTNPLVSFFFNGLNFHSVHHAFVKIPFYNLKIAHDRISTKYGERCPILEEDSYLGVAIEAIKKPVLIGDRDPGSQVGQARMEPITLK